MVLVVNGTLFMEPALQPHLRSVWPQEVQASPDFLSNQENFTLFWLPLFGPYEKFIRSFLGGWRTKEEPPRANHRLLGRSPKKGNPT